ncbi:protease inhibitor I9 family protein [Nonomuraea sp. NPDC049158]|uniref:protease inhibitor I9 family protein n=1 Tax=Nonomuraea sp. NPDC049158 TaxID=3155649 RepID=UPI0033D1917A
MLLALAPAVAFHPAQATDGEAIGHAVNGFSATLTPEEVALLRANPDVIAIEADKAHQAGPRAEHRGRTSLVSAVQPTVEPRPHRPAIRLE